MKPLIKKHIKKKIKELFKPGRAIVGLNTELSFDELERLVDYLSQIFVIVASKSAVINSARIIWFDESNQIRFVGISTQETLEQRIARHNTTHYYKLPDVIPGKQISAKEALSTIELIMRGDGSTAPKDFTPSVKQPEEQTKNLKFSPITIDKKKSKYISTLNLDSYVRTIKLPEKTISITVRKRLKTSKVQGGQS